MIRTLLSVMAIGLGLVAGVPAEAGTLRVSPVRLQVPASGAATVVNLRNDGGEAVMVQARVFRWVQQDGRDLLVPTRDVVVSPPMVKLQPGVKSVVRVVRTSRAAIRGEETYRVLIDELPAVQDTRSVVSMVVRQSIPLIFTAAGGRGPQVTFAIDRRGRDSGDLVVTNSGDRGFRFNEVAVLDGSGRPMPLGAKLFGYVHSGATMRFPLRASGLGNLAGGRARIVAMGDGGRIDASAAVR